MSKVGNELNNVKTLFICLTIIWAGISTPIMAQSGDAGAGAEVYGRRCIWCHGEEGDAVTDMAERLNPPPRDFTFAQYKIKATAFDNDYPNDDDLFRMIRDGMPGTAMPGWADVLSDQQIWDLVAYIKAFGGLEEEEPGPIMDYGKQVTSSAQSIEQGEKLFHEDDRCSECHGEQGKGDAVKGLKDDAGFRTWPRNLTKPWTFRASNDPKDIYTRISTGIPGTQMPAFADPVSDKKLTIEERWHVANYVNSLAKTQKVVKPENTVVKADKVAGDLPSALDDPLWEQTEPSTFFLVSQIIGEERFFTPSNDTITARALYSDTEIAILLEWDDRTKSIPGNETAEKISDPEIAEDGVAIQLPVAIPTGTEKPYFGMGDAAHPVNVWHWTSGTTDTPQSVSLINANGFDNIERRDAEKSGISAQGIYHNGTWQVLMKRALSAADKDKDIELIEGKTIPIAFAAWDGSNSEKGSRHTMTTWYWLLLKPAVGARPIVSAAVAGFLMLGVLLWWQRTASGKRTPANVQGKVESHEQS